MPGFDRSDRSNMRLVTDETIPMRGIDKIELGFASDECTVYLTEDDNIGVKHYVRNVSEGCYARIEGYGSTVAISTKPQGLFDGITFFGVDNRSVVEIYLPKAYKNELDVEVMSGKLLFDGDLDLSGLSMHISSGSINSEYAVKAPNTDITVTSGSIKITGGIIAEDYTLKTSSGSLTIDGGLKGSGRVNVTSGKIKLFGVDITDDLSAEVSSGSLDINIAGNPSLYFSGKRSSGSIRTYFGNFSDGRTFSKTTGEDPYKSLEVSVTSGTVRITN